MSVCVVGSANLDTVLRVAELPAGGVTVVAERREVGVGGKGLNQAIAAARAGAKTSFVGVIGPDDSRDIRSTLDGSGVESVLEERDGGSSGAVVVVDADGENLIVVSANGTAGWRPNAEQIARVESADRVVLQLELGADLARDLAAVARAAGAWVILNASPVPPGADLRGVADILVVNEHEALALGADPADLAGGLRAIAPDVVVTLGARGCLVTTPDGVTAIEGVPTAVVDTTGAGDTFCGYLVAGLHRGLSLPDSARWAGAAAARSVARAGASESIPWAQEGVDP